jgi:hypothetical protein
LYGLNINVFQEKVEEAEYAEVYQALERRFKDVSSHLSMGACAKRAREDIAATAMVAMEAEMKSTFIFKIVFAIAVPLVMMFVTPLLVKLFMMIGKPIGDFLSPRVVEACSGYLLSFMVPVLEDSIGTYLIGKLEKSLAAKLGPLLVDSLTFHLPRVLGRSTPPQMTNYVLRASYRRHL